MNRQRIHRITGTFCTVFMLIVLPLLFHDAFFDINRFKVLALCCAACISGIVCVFTADFKKQIDSLKHAPTGWLLLLLCACVISSARTGFDPATLTGREGRYAGLWFLLACVVSFLIIASTSLPKRRFIQAGVFTASFIALLGVLNAFGLDPLQFYRRIQRGQESAFLSTIGNINFFGAYLVLFLPYSISSFLHASRTKGRGSDLFVSLILTLGILVSRTDSAFLGMQMVFLCLFAYSGDSLEALSRVSLLWGGSYLLLPPIGYLLVQSRFNAEMTGLLGILSKTGLAYILALCLFAYGFLCIHRVKNRKRAPGKTITRLVAIIVVTLCSLILLTGIILFTFILPDAEIGSLASFLRFNDYWGSYRGFVYARSIRAFSAFSATDKLFGQGVDLARRILTPYFDHPEILLGGVFNDAHCQILQLLITCGLCGAGAFLGFYLSMLNTVAKQSPKEPLSTAHIAMLAGYLPIMLLNVFQPILIAEFLSLSALALAQSCESGIKEVSFNEP